MLSSFISMIEDVSSRRKGSLVVFPLHILYRNIIPVWHSCTVVIKTTTTKKTAYMGYRIASKAI